MTERELGEGATAAMHTNGSGGPAAQDAGPADRQDELSIVGFANVVLRHRYLIAATVFLVMVVTAGVLVRIPATYTTESLFMPQARNPLGGMSSIAAQFGFRLGNQDSGLSPDFYVALVRSRPVLGAAVDTEYRTKAGAQSLADHFRIRVSDSDLRREETIEALDAALHVFAHRPTGVVHLRVTLEDAELSKQVSERLLGLVNAFNLTSRQSQAAAEAQFTAGRLEEVRAELLEMEERLVGFLRSNREYRNSPTLLFEHDRLARQVAMQQEIHSALGQAHEQARIEEVRTTPVITIVASPEVPARPDQRGRLARLLAALVAGLVVGIVFAFWRDLTTPDRERTSTTLQEFRRLQYETWEDIKRPWRTGRRVRQETQTP
jgi:uncharacterized protein involved in exopolysaccharide biosynthesis